MRISMAFARFAAGFQEFVDSVENHEAVARRAIQDAREGVARLEVQRRRAESAAGRLQRQIDDQQQTIARWRERATTSAQSDRDRAVICVQRLMECEEQLEPLRQRRAEYDELIERLRSALVEARSRVADMELRRSELAGREALARTAPDLNADAASEAFEEVLERWEMKVVTRDATSDWETAGSTGDLLEANFRKEEHTAAAEARLQALLDQVEGETE